MRKLILFLLCVLFAHTAHAAPSAELWDYWQHSGERTGIDHAAWQEFLDTYVIKQAVGPNLVRYADVTAADKQRLRNYINDLSKQAIRTYTKDEQFAYWTNLYNAQTVLLVLEHYPIESITRIKPSLFSFGPWNKKLLTIESQSLSLNDIEHRILRPIWQDERIHYVVNCASFSCPSLPTKAVPAINRNAFLDKAAKDYINDIRAVGLTDNTLTLSSIYDWYVVDFGSVRDLTQHLAHYHDTLDAKTISTYINNADYQYDWQLNEAQEPK